MTGAHISSIVINKLCHWQEFCLIIQFEIDKGLKIDFYYVVLTFGLAICLKIEGYRKSLFDFKKVAK